MHRDLFRLKVSGNRRLSDRGFVALVKSLRNLGVAFFKHCPMITGAGLTALVNACSKLEELHTEGAGITAESLLVISKLELLDKLTISEDVSCTLRSRSIVFVEVHQQDLALICAHFSCLWTHLSFLISCVDVAA